MITLWYWLWSDFLQPSDNSKGFSSLYREGAPGLVKLINFCKDTESFLIKKSDTPNRAVVPDDAAVQ